MSSLTAHLKAEGGRLPMYDTGGWLNSCVVRADLLLSLGRDLAASILRRTWRLPLDRPDVLVPQRRLVGIGRVSRDVLDWSVDDNRIQHVDGHGADITSHAHRNRRRLVEAFGSVNAKPLAIQSRSPSSAAIASGAT
jgi:hypothetical protein